MKQKIWQKRGLAALLALVLLVSTGAPAAWAGDGDPTDVGTWTDLKNAAAAGGSIRLTQNLSLAIDGAGVLTPVGPNVAGLYVGNNLTIDLNGCDLVIETPGSLNNANGIKLAQDVKLTIQDTVGTGTLTVINNCAYGPVGGCSAAINTTQGILAIEGGTVNAQGGRGGAGIGGGVQGAGGIIDIGGGTVDAIGGDFAAGIGGGLNGNGGKIDIRGGTIEKAQGGYDGAGIGGGSQGAGGTITISGGTIKNAQGGYDGAGIGGGWSGSGGTITISGGTIKNAQGGVCGAGIGGGGNSSLGGTITILGGSITATGGDQSFWGAGAGIGGGGGDSSSTPGCGKIYIHAATKLEATGGHGSATEGGHAGAGIGAGGVGKTNTYVGKVSDPDNTIYIANAVCVANTTSIQGGDGNGANAGADIGTGGSANGAGTPLTGAPSFTAPDASKSIALNESATLEMTLDDMEADGFCLWYEGETNDFAESTLMSGEDSRTLTIPATTVGTKYYFCLVGAKDRLATVSTTKVDIVPHAPTDLTAKRANQRVDLSWKTPDITTGIDGYNVHYYETGSTTETVNFVSGKDVTSTTIDGLTNGTEYTFKVCAVNSAAKLESEPTEDVTAKPLASLPLNNNNSGNVTAPSKDADKDADKDTSKPSDGTTDPILPNTLPFTDVVPTDWFYGDVQYVWEHKTMNGVTDTLFAPNSEVTRGMVATVLWRMQGAPAASGASPFTDLSQDWYKPAVAWCYENGIVQGMGDGAFAPEASITREQLMTMMHRYMTYAKTEYTVTEQYVVFPDESSISSYAKEAVQVLNKLGVVTGMPDGSIDPQGTATRAQLAAILHRFMTL